MRIFSRLKGAGMGTIVIVTAVLGFLLLAAATGTLVAMNWSEKTLTPALSILLVGTATTLVAVVVQLKESRVESAFATSVVLDINAGGPPMAVTSTIPVAIPRWSIDYKNSST